MRKFKRRFNAFLFFVLLFSVWASVQGEPINLQGRINRTEVSEPSQLKCRIFKILAEYIAADEFRQWLVEVSDRCYWKGVFSVGRNTLTRKDLEIEWRGPR